MRKLINLFLIAVITVAVVMISCADKDNFNMSQTGLIDQNGNVVSGTLIKTNVIWVTNRVDNWITNGGVNSITTNEDGSIKIEYGTNILVPNLPDNPTDLYRIRVPFAGKGDGYYTMDYRDYNGLKQLWLDQIQRKGADDGKVFAIRNRENNRGYDFQNPHDGREDYYYFADNGDIYYKGGDKNNKTGATLMKRFVGATIVDYRKVTQRWNQSETRADDKIENTGEWTVGGIYKMAVTLREAEIKFADAGVTDGAYEFIAARRELYTFFSPWSFVAKSEWFIRQYHNTDNIEVLVLNPYENGGYADGLSVDSYYAYSDNLYGVGSEPMRNEKLFIGERPEYVVPMLTHTTTFTDASRGWAFLALAGHRENNARKTTTSQRITRKF